MPHRLIGRTAGFGPVSRGSSPRGATKTKKSGREFGLFLCLPLPRACSHGRGRHKKRKPAQPRLFLVFGYTANCIRTVPAQPGQSSFIENPLPRACSHGRGGRKKRKPAQPRLFLVFGYTANCIRTVPVQPGQSS